MKQVGDVRSSDCFEASVEGAKRLERVASGLLFAGAGLLLHLVSHFLEHLIC